MPQDPSQPQVASGYYPADGGYSAPEQYASISSEKIIPAGSIIELPYHRKDGKPIQLRLDEDVRESDLQADIDAQFPKTAQNIALEMLESPEKVSKEDFDFALQQSEAMQGARGLREKGDQKTLSRLADVLPHALSSLYEGALALGQSGVMAINTELTTRQQLNALGSIVEGGIRGTKQLADIGRMGFNLATLDKYDAYAALKDMQAQEEIYKQGGGTIPLDPWAAEQANKIKNVLDVTVLMPGIGSLLGNLGKEVAVQTIKDVAKQTSVGVGRKAAAFAASGIGSTGREILDAASKKFGESAGKIALAGGVSAGVQDDGGVLTGLGTALALYGAPTALKYSMSTLKWAGKIAGADAASEVIAQGLKDATEKGVSEPVLRAVAKALPGDSAMRAFGQIADSSINGGLIGATIAGVQAAADPFNTGGDILEQAFIGGVAGTAVGAAIGPIPAIAEYSAAGRNRAFVREMAKDIAGRPENRSFVVDGQEIPVADIQNRIKLLNNEEMSTTDKARIFAILKSAEYSGNDVGFIDNNTVLPESLGGKGEFMGKGVRVTPGYDGKRSTVLVNVDQITPASAIEEVAHTFISREAAKKFVSDLVVDRGGVSAALEPLIELGQRYYDLQLQSNPQAAAKFGRDLAMAKDANLPPEVRQQAAITLAEEWAANGIGEYLKNEDPTVLQVGRGNQNFIGDIIRKGLFEINSGLNLKPTAPTYDPITGFYYKDGKLIDDPVLADISKKMKNAILFFDKNEGAYFPSDRAAGKPRAKAPTKSPAEQAGVQINDKLIDGTLITGTRPMARYEDTHAVDQKSGAKAGAETTKTGVKPRGKEKTELGKDDYHNIVFQQFAKITGEQALDPEANAIGLYFGNTSKVPAGTPIVYTRSLDNAQLEGLFNIQTHQGKPLIAPENRDAVARFNQAAKDGSIIVVDYDMNIGKETAGRKYAVSGQQVLLPLGIQQTQTGGPIAGVYNLSLLNDIINYQRLLPGMEKVDGALAQFGINTLADVVPLVRTHIENYSSAGALPGVDALMAAYPNVSKESATILRDLMHLSSNIQPRKSAPDVRKNEPFIGSLTELPRRKVEAYSVQGERSETVMARERSVSNDIRLDAIRNTQLYAGPDGLPVKVNVNLEQYVPKQRSNFSPSRSIPETLGDKQVITDPETGRRAFIQPNGRTKVYGNDGALMGVYEDFTEAQTKLNQADMRFSPRSPAAIARRAEEAKAMRARMEEEAPVRIMTEWLSAAGQAKQKETPSERAEPQRAKGKVRPSIVEQAKVQAQSELLRRAESTAGYAQLSKGQKAQFLKDAAEARNGIAQKALERIAAQQQAKREAFQQEVEAFKTNTKAYLAKKDVPFLDIEETRQVLRKKPSKRIEATPTQLEAIARLEVAPEFVRRDLGPTPKPTKPGTYSSFEALSSVGLPKEDVPIKQTISPRVVNLLGTAPTKSMARILSGLAQRAGEMPKRKQPPIGARKFMAQILDELAKKAADMPKREPVRIEPTAIPEPQVEIVTPIDEPRLPSNMIVTRTPKGNFQLYVITSAGKISSEGLYKNYRETLQRAQTKHQRRYATR